MQAGKLRHRITIERPVAARNEYGEDVPTWQTYWQCWANVVPLDGTEKWNASQVQPQVKHVVEMRFKAGILPEFRVSFKGRYLYVESSIDVGERGREGRLVCIERA